jgi:crotonobetainyl-CoA:carnitine CoA-transferase CaiB-like acyl-CoA transferase
MGNHIPERIGSTHPNIAPYGELFTSKDKVTLTFAIGSDKQFNKLCSVLGIEELAGHPHFVNNQVRVENRLSLASYLQDVIGHLKASDIEEAMSQNFVPVARIKNLKEVFASQEAQDLILNETVDGIETKRVKTTVFNITKSDIE